MEMVVSFMLWPLYPLHPTGYSSEKKKSRLKISLLGDDLWFNELF
jgi:hypothetical protein